MRFFRKNSRRLHRDKESVSVSQIYGEIGSSVKGREKTKYDSKQKLPGLGVYYFIRDKIKNRPTILDRRKGEGIWKQRLRATGYTAYQTYSIGNIPFYLYVGYRVFEPNIHFL